MATTIKNSGGNRALVAYLYAPELFDEEINGGEIAAFDSVINDVLKDVEYSDGGTIEREIDTPRTVAITLSSGTWARSLKIGNCGGDLIVGIYFYTAPPAPEPDPDSAPDVEPDEPDDAEKWREYMSAYQSINQDEEPEPPSITSLICDALQGAFPDGKVGATSFVINPDLIDFELEVE